MIWTAGLLGGAAYGAYTALRRAGASWTRCNTARVTPSRLACWALPSRFFLDRMG